jgi:hypothetical protein
MDNHKSLSKRMANRYRTGWAILLSGCLAGAIGVLIQQQFGSETANYRIITGLGIVTIGVGIAKLVTWRRAMKNEAEARRLEAELSDERTVMIRSLAGNRAYWVSAVIIYAGLLWTSFESSNNLPALGGDALWYFLAAAVVIPAAVYIISMMVDERKL